MKWSGRGFFLSAFLTYCAILAVNLAAFLFVYARTYIASKEQAASTVEFFLGRGRDLFDARLEELEDNAARLASDSDIRSFMRLTDPLAPEDYYQLYRMGAEFQRYNMRSTFADRVYLIFRDSKVVLSNEYANPNVEWFYPHFLRYAGLAYDEWSRSIDLWSRNSALLPLSTISDLSTDRVALTFRLPVSNGIATPRAVLLVLIPEQTVHLYFEEILRIGGRIRILSRDGSVLFDSAETNAAGLEKRPAAHVTVHSPSTVLRSTTGHIRQIRYEAIVPADYVDRSAAPVTSLYLAVLTGTIAVGFAAAWLFAARQSRPISRIFRLISLNDDGASAPSCEVKYDYSWLESRIENLVGQQFDVKRALSEQLEILKSGFYERLLRGGFESEIEIRDCLNEIGLSFRSQQYRVALAYTDPASAREERTVNDAVIHSYLTDRVPEGWHVHSDSGGTILIIPSAAVQTLEHELRELAQADIRVRLAVGPPVASLMEVRRSFGDAVSVRRLAPKTEERFAVSVYESVDENATPAAFSHRTAEQLAASALAGNAEGAAAILDRVYTDNFRGDTPCTTARQSMLADLTFEVVRIVQELPAVPPGLPSDFIRYLESYENPEDAFARARSILAAVCREVEAGKQSHNERRINGVLEYLEESFTDPMVCLCSVAERFDLNPQYFSRYFKEQTGQSFSAYLESLRMDLATERMTSSDDSLQNIATAAGYLSWNSFYKAFRRRYGVSPGKLRSGAG